MQYHRVFHLTCDIVGISDIVGTADDHRVSEWNGVGCFILVVILWTYCLLLEHHRTIE
jgi:hypothetical protein